MTSAIVVKDPVCGMDVETTGAAGQSKYKGESYFFCSSGCKGKFDLNPEQYLSESAGTAKSGHSCCG